MIFEKVMKTFICGPIDPNEIAGEIAFICSLIGELGSRKVWLSYESAKRNRSKTRRVEASRLGRWIGSLIRRGTYVPAAEMFLCDVHWISARISPEPEIFIGSPDPENVRKFVTRWLERGYRLAERCDHECREVHDVETALLETTPAEPAIGPPTTQTIRVDGLPMIARSTQEIAAGKKAIGKKQGVQKWAIGCIMDSGQVSKKSWLM